MRLLLAASVAAAAPADTLDAASAIVDQLVTDVATMPSVHDVVNRAVAGLAAAAITWLLKDGLPAATRWVVATWRKRHDHQPPAGGAPLLNSVLAPQ